MPSSVTTKLTDSLQNTPIGIVLVSLLLALVGILGVGYGGVAVVTGNTLLAAIAVIVVPSFLLAAYFLHEGSLLAWWIALTLAVASTLGSLGSVADGNPGRLPVAIVGLVIVGYLLSQYGYFQEGQ